MGEVAGWIEAAVLRVLEAGHRTADIAAPGGKKLGTREMGDHVVKELEAA
jgi:3-isopropylmalate dehydrogenase